MKCYTNFKKHHSTIQKKSTLVRLQEIFLRLYTCAKRSRWVRFFTNFETGLKNPLIFHRSIRKDLFFGNIRKAELKTWTISLCKYIFFGKRINYWNDIAFLILRSRLAFLSFTTCKKIYKEKNIHERHLEIKVTFKKYFSNTICYVKKIALPVIYASNNH